MGEREHVDFPCDRCGEPLDARVKARLIEPNTTVSYDRLDRPTKARQFSFDIKCEQCGEVTVCEGTYLTHD